MGDERTTRKRWSRRHIRELNSGAHMLPTRPPLRPTCNIFQVHIHSLFLKKIVIVCFTSYFVFSCIDVLPHSPGVVYYHLLLRRETRIPGVAPFSFRIGIWDLFVHRGQKSYTPTAFGKLWTTPGVRCMQHASS